MKAVIFDFDGTLTDIHKNWDESVQLINQALTKHKLRTFTSNELLELRRKQTKEMIQALNIPFYKAPFLIPKLFSELRHIFPHPIAYQPMIDELVTIRSLVNIVGILTSNTYESVSHFLDKHNLTPTFDFVVSNKNVFGKHQSLTKLLK
ncbi:HAD hydrolase-like protein, partial [candidate division WWE3 bacterium]|nr:HAD hydrolase-like protein [candidate division WWE3 bacterium]